LRSTRDPAEINIGTVVRETESDFFMAECFNKENNTCPLTPDCLLKAKLGQATAAFLAVLDTVTLASILEATPGAPALAAGVIPLRVAK
jgi:Rrf2 family nitric oxide-sensitive transcriptional repressor